MNLQEKYDELDIIITNLRDLIDEVTMKDFKEQLQEVLYQAMQEKEEIEDDVIALQEAEEKEMNREYERGVL